MVSRPKKVNWQNPSGKTQIPCHFATSPLQPQNHRPMYDRMGLFSWKGEPMNNDTSNRSTPATASPLTVKEAAPPVMIKKIEKTTYRVKIHFSETSKETMSDKIKRLILNDSEKSS